MIGSRQKHGPPAERFDQQTTDDGRDDRGDGKTDAPDGHAETEVPRGQHAHDGDHRQRRNDPARRALHDAARDGDPQRVRERANDRSCDEQQRGAAAQR